MKTIVVPTEDCVRAAAERLVSLIENKKDASVALGAGDDELCVLRCAAHLAKERGVSLRGLRAFAACEFADIAPGDPNSARERIRTAFFAGTDAREDRLFAPDASAPAAYDALIERAGGIDLALLGLGENARVAFNEPATQFDTNTHVQKLTDKTKRELEALFGGADKVPPRGVTMGFQQLCFAREILVIALGAEKSKAVFHMLYGRDDSVYPAAFLQLPPNVTVYADPAAAAMLNEKGFDLVALYGK